MSLTLNWTDRNITVDKFRVYRANSPILDGALPAFLAEVPAGTFTYTDATAVRNQVYHYRVSAVVGTEETLSSNMPLAYMPYTGPGPQKLLRGDWSYGTFGRINPEDLFSAAEMVSLCGLPSGLVPVGSSALTCWHKLVYNGKILFVPDMVCGYGLSTFGPVMLYQAGLMYGSDDPSTWSAAMKSTYGTIPQNFQLLKNADQFTVRAPSSRVGALTGSAVPANQTGGEFDLLIAPLFQTRTFNYTPAQLDDLLYVAGVYTLTKDVTTTAGDTMIFRGSTTAVADTLYTAALASTSSQFGWRPVLELVL